MLLLTPKNMYYGLGRVVQTERTEKSLVGEASALSKFTYVIKADSNIEARFKLMSSAEAAVWFLPTFLQFHFHHKLMKMLYPVFKSHFKNLLKET